MKNKKSHSGQSLVEFALVFPLVFFLMVGFIDLGRAIYFYSSLSTAVREGTRYAIVHADALNQAYGGDSSIISNKVKSYLFGINASSSNLNIVATVTRDSTTNFNKDVNVTATYCFKAITPFISQIVKKQCPGSQPGLPIKANSTMHVAPIAH